MDDRLGEIKRRLKSGVQNQNQARILAREAAALLNPEATETRHSLEEAFGQIPIADQFRGESKAARKSAINALEEFRAKPRPSSKSTNPPSRHQPDRLVLT